MSQASVLKLLERAKKPLRSKQIAQMLQVSMGTINSNLQRLLEQGDVEFIFQKDKKGITRNVYFVRGLRTSEIKKALKIYDKPRKKPLTWLDDFLVSNQK